MWRFILSVGAALLLVAGPAVAQQQQTKTVKGSITSIAANSVTVKAADGKEMTFNIDSTTQVIAPGAGTKAREAKAEGKGLSAVDLLKTGQTVEIRYHEAEMHAQTIRSIPSAPAESRPAPEAGGKPQAQMSHTASGVVSAISGNSVTVKGSSGEWIFSVDEKTTVSGEGVGTAGRKMAGEGKQTTLSELLKEGDSVSVTYHDMDGKKHASVIRLIKRKM